VNLFRAIRGWDSAPKELRIRWDPDPLKGWQELGSGHAKIIVATYNYYAALHAVCKIRTTATDVA